MDEVAMSILTLYRFPRPVVDPSNHDTIGKFNCGTSLAYNHVLRFLSSLYNGRYYVPEKLG